MVLRLDDSVPIDVERVCVFALTLEAKLTIAVESVCVLDVMTMVWF